jgi:hypothetical protein
MPAEESMLDLLDRQRDSLRRAYDLIGPRDAAAAGRSTGTSSPDLLEKLRSQMDAGFQRRNEEFIKEVFNKHKSEPHAGLSKENLAALLRDLGVSLSDKEVEALFHTLDLNDDGWISLSELPAVVAKTSENREIQQWATSLPLAEVLADCMPFKNEEDPVRALSQLQSAEIQTVAACLCEGLVKLLRCVCVFYCDWVSVLMRARKQSSGA